MDTRLGGSNPVTTASIAVDCTTCRHMSMWISKMSATKSYHRKLQAVRTRCGPCAEDSAGLQEGNNEGGGKSVILPPQMQTRRTPYPTLISKDEATIRGGQFCNYAPQINLKLNGRHVRQFVRDLRKQVVRRSLVFLAVNAWILRHSGVVFKHTG